MLGKIFVAIFALCTTIIACIALDVCFSGPIEGLPVNILVAIVWVVICVFANLVAYLTWSKRHGGRRI